jgi:cell division transport system permease protein
MRAVDYALRQAWVSLRRARGATTFAVLAIALALIVLGALLLVTWNSQRVVSRLADAAEFSVYLADDATSEQRGAIEAAIDASGVAGGRDYISKEQARERFDARFRDLAAVARSFGDNPFPASVEVQVKPSVDDTVTEAAVHQIGSMPGVSDVRYDREWLAAFGRGIGALSAAGLTLAILMAFAAGVTVAAVVRLGLQARRDEIEIMELVGAPMAFIRGPFVAEGLLQGGIGAILALIALWVGFLFARAWWGAPLASALDGAALEFLPLTMCLYLLFGGMAVGSAGGFVAARYAGSGH